MHPFFLVGLVLHATAIAVIGFFVLFAAVRAEGWLKLLGKGLGIWVLILAVVSLLGGAAFSIMGGQDEGAGMMHGAWFGHMRGDHEAPVADAPSTAKPGDGDAQRTPAAKPTSAP